MKTFFLLETSETSEPDFYFQRAIFDTEDAANNYGRLLYQHENIIVTEIVHIEE